MSRVLTSWRPSRLASNLAMVMSDGGVALVYLTVVMVAFTVIASTVVLAPIAAVVLWCTLLAGGWLARVERSRFAALAGVALTPVVHAPLSGGPWQRFLSTVRDGDRWRELAYVGLQPLWGLVSFSIGVATWSAPVTVLAYRLTDGWGTGRTPELWVVEATPLTWTAVCVAAGVWLVVVAPLLTDGLARVDVRLAQRFLTPPEVGNPRRIAARAESRRAAAVSSAEEERRRIERDLHDGAQQRLIAAALELGQARAALPDDPQRAKRLVDHTHEEIKGVLKDLRDLVRGLRPVILEDRGLDAALSAVVARCPFPVDISVAVEPRPEFEVESAAYFIVSEALANTMRHADATQAWVAVARVGNTIDIVVTDNGRGGAQPSLGSSPTADGQSGLVGLMDRARGLGGSVDIVSPAGGPTRLHAELPCAL